MYKILKLFIILNIYVQTNKALYNCLVKINYDTHYSKLKI